jgi:hypothetical protein
MIFRYLASALALSAIASSAFGQEADDVFVQNGVQFAGSYNEHGLVLRPDDGAPGVIYLGIGCDVFSPSRGTGRWSALGNSVFVELTTGQTLLFDGSIRRELQQNCPL